MSLTSIKQLAESEFENFILQLENDYPELILQYKIAVSMKNLFVESVIRQVWIQKEYNISEILQYIKVLNNDTSR